MERASLEPRWLAQYASEGFGWQATQLNGRQTYYRPLGLVEYSFDSDGKHFEGRADMNALLQLEAKHSLSGTQLQNRIQEAWACLRSRHLLLQAKSIPRQHWMEGRPDTNTDMHFVVELPSTWDQAIADARQHVVFLADHYERIDANDFWSHCQNSSRVIDANLALGKLFVLPPELCDNGNVKLRFLAVIAHGIVDGLTGYLWMRDLLELLNKTSTELAATFHIAIQPEVVRRHLPPAQESLYPPISGSVARRRWFWLLTRILRNVRKPLPAGFPNPLRRSGQPLVPKRLSAKYASVLDYSHVPPLNSLPLFSRINLTGTQRLHRLCKEANVSIGAGCFTLAAILMMEAYELREPDIPLSNRRPFITGFPVNPRPFFEVGVQPDSLMLAFSDGIMLPFLPSSLPLDGRIRLLARQAHRQLSVYQKRKRIQGLGYDLRYMGSRGAGRLLAIQYLTSLERADQKLPKQLQQGINPQGMYPARPNATLQTCGVSSVGRIDGLINRGMFDLNGSKQEFVADFSSLDMTVRAREGEFLVGCGGSDIDIWASVTVDTSTMDPEWTDWWRRRFERILTEDYDASKAMI